MSRLGIHLCSPVPEGKARSGGGRCGIFKAGPMLKTGCWQRTETLGSCAAGSLAYAHACWSSAELGMLAASATADVDHCQESLQQSAIPHVTDAMQSYAMLKPMSVSKTGTDIVCRMRCCCSAARP
jgi:hypothetical protein